MQIILASQSPFRKRALEILGLSFTTAPSHFNEAAYVEKNAKLRARSLAREKARSMIKAHPHSIVIAADCLAEVDGTIYEKPTDKQEATRMLMSFSGKTMNVWSGLTVLNTATKKMKSGVVKTVVKFRTLSEHEIKDYVERFPVLSASASLENSGIIRFSEKVQGDFGNVNCGLPVGMLIDFLRFHGVEV